MKKAILILALTGLSAPTIAQNKTSTPAPDKHPDYALNPILPVNFTATLNANLIQTYLYVQSQGGISGVEHSSQLTGDKIQSIKTVYQTAVDSLNAILIRHFNNTVKADMTKFTADTSKLYHPLKK